MDFSFLEIGMNKMSIESDNKTEMPMTLSEMIAKSQLGNNVVPITGIANTNIESNGSATTISHIGRELIYKEGPSLVSYATKDVDEKLLVQPSNFNMCADINYLVGNTIERSKAVMEHQKKIIQGEWEELCHNVEKGNIEALRDDIADMLFTVYGMAARLGIPADEDFKLVCDSQYTKFDTCLEDAIKTRDRYLKRGIETYFEIKPNANGEKLWVTYSASDQIDIENKPYPKGKWLKSANFKEPVFKPLEY